MAAQPTLLEQLAEHDERVKAANARVQSLARTSAEHSAQVQQLKAERIAAYSDGDEDAAKRLKTRADRAGARSIELDERRQGAELAARRVQGEREAFITEKLAGLIGERRPAAIEAVRRIEEAVADVADAVAAWNAEARQQEAFLREAGHGTRGMPDLPIARLARDLERVAADGLPAPLPGAHPAPPAAQIEDGDAADDEQPLVEVVE